MNYRYRLRPIEWIIGLAATVVAIIVCGGAAQMNISRGNFLLGVSYLLALMIIAVLMLVIPMRFPDLEVRPEGIVIRYPFCRVQRISWDEIERVEEDYHGLQPGRVKPELRVWYKSSPHPDGPRGDQRFTVSPQISQYDELRKILLSREESRNSGT